MNFNAPRRRQSEESIIPMINVVFLLLIFFLMTAQITAPDPFELAIPTSPQENEPEGEATLYISKEAMLGYEGTTGPEAFEALLAGADKTIPLKLRADAELAAVEVAKILKRLTEVGFIKVDILVNG